ncbi:sensor histidine kinase [Hymenobacter puniceus]|uniref:sensor histidine kinase n=1 Tax=Hymenobacter sp. BT190 TaxID=2763505 RepID=UPI0016513C1E|nr:hybrid sensor histidine kinase/response regulator [Hymenobacter sp. BT190]MBC6698694.1 hybrid sensor histidine kinase/response regulator [Hymenobacter sp. BT190]
MKRIMLIDDNPEDRMLYRRYLGRQVGHERLEIVEAASGEEGLALFQHFRPDCILLDYNLPDTDGLEMLDQLGQLVPRETLCVVMITGGGNESIAVRALNNGALDYLVKQHFDRELLYKTVLHAIEKNEWRQYQNRYHAEIQTMNRQLRDSLAELTNTRQALDSKNAELTAANDQVTARNQQLARSNQDLDNFVYAASHDLKQPVNNLQGLFEELSRTTTVRDADTATILRLFKESLQSLATTINDLAAVVQEQRPASLPLSESVELAELTADVEQELRPQIIATGAVIDTDFSKLSTLQYVRINLRTILLNLLSNALKYSHPCRRPHVQIRTYQLAGQPVLEVQDNGLGLNLERHGAELFQLFRRFHPQASDGTGVGLFLVNRLVEGPGGHIEVESKEHHGTTFRLFLQGSTRP